jgi:putative restriction endonuclease
LVFTAAGDPTLTSLRAVNPVGRLPDAVADVLRANPSLIAEIAYTLLDAHFPPSIHEDVLTAVALDPEALSSGPARLLRRPRDPQFRDSVLRAYGYRCAVCAFETRIRSTLVGVDAAHVQWHRADGPDAVPNGLALCALHHRLLDRGAFTVVVASARERIVAVAEDAHGGEGFERWLLAFHGRPIAEPVSAGYRVAEPFAAWHHREVFRGRARS